MILADVTGPSARRVITAYLALWCTSVGYLAFAGADWVFPVVALILFGIGLSALAWALTRGLKPQAIEVVRPKNESLTLLVYLAVYAVVLVGVGLGVVRAFAPEGVVRELLIICYKLVIHVGLPALIIVGFQGQLKPLLRGIGRERSYWTTFVVLAAILFGLLAVVSPSLNAIAATGVIWPTAFLWILASWIWMSVEAGLCEEFLFRACLQSRLSAWLDSPLAAVLLVSVLFALSHWPGLYLRGSAGTDGWSTDPVQVAAFTIATLSPLSIFFGVLWERTRSLLLIALLHGAVDALPNTAEMIILWR